MNWKDYPYLFASGKFKIKIIWEDGLIEILPIYLSPSGRICADLLKRGDTKTRKAPYQIIALMARSINSMTDDEVEKVTAHMIRPAVMGFDTRQLLKNKDDFRLALNLLSIGVLPEVFKWDETVIIDALEVAQ